MNEEKRGLEQGDIAVCMIVGGFVVMILSAFLVGLLGIGSIILLVISILSVIIGFIMIMVEKSNDNAAHIANINAFQEEYDKYVDKLGIGKSDTHVTLFELGKYDFEVKISHYLWIANDCIKLFPMAEYYRSNRTSSMSRPDISELKLKSIPIDSILYFEEVGEVNRYEIEVPVNSTIKRVLFGEVILDGCGEVVGIGELTKTQIVTEDNRKVELVYKKAKNKKETLVFKHDAYEIFKKLIPSKELQE